MIECPYCHADYDDDCDPGDFLECNSDAATNFDVYTCTCEACGKKFLRRDHFGYLFTDTQTIDEEE